jgi:hypothetical protein
MSSSGRRVCSSANRRGRLIQVRSDLRLRTSIRSATTARRNASPLVRPCGKGGSRGGGSDATKQNATSYDPRRQPAARRRSGRSPDRKGAGRGSRRSAVRPGPRPYSCSVARRLSCQTFSIILSRSVRNSSVKSSVSFLISGSSPLKFVTTAHLIKICAGHSGNERATPGGIAPGRREGERGYRCSATSRSIWPAPTGEPC